jgi:malonyl-CoA/methylmalonyl-CoA synthetase
MPFLDTLASHFRTYPDKVALEFVEPPVQRTTYAELGLGVQRTMRYLQSLGVEPGDRVALQLPKSLEFICLHLANLYLGAITLPLNPAYPADETLYFLQDSGARALFAAKSAAPRLKPLLPKLPGLKDCVLLDPSDPDHFEALLPQAPEGVLRPNRSDPGTISLILYTSGTHGRPKGAQIMQSNLTANLEALHEYWGWQSGDVLLHVLPIFHVHGLSVALHGALNAGATTLLMREFDARKTLETLVGRRCTVFMGVPTIHRRLLAASGAASYDLSHMRLLTSGSDRLPDEVFTGFQETFGHTLLERYGMTETGMNLSNPLNGERRIGSVGFPLPRVEARVVDPETGESLPDGQVGEVQIRGPHVFKGYWQQPEKTEASFTRDGWFRTGDLGLRQPDGYFTLKGRSKDLIITGGFNVYPPEVERVLADHPAVAANAVIGCPDLEWGERVVAVVVPKAGEAISSQELIEFCQQRLVAYKCPREVYFNDGLPRNAMGKVQKVKLKQQFCRG